MNLIFIAGIAEKLRDWFTGFSGALLSLIPKTLYALCTLIFSMMDILQVLIRKVAGLDKVWYTVADYGNLTAGMHGGAGGQTGDIAYHFIRNILLGETPILSNVFWGMIILGLILLFLTTLVALFRSEYATLDSKSSSKGKIIGQSLKAIFSFAVVPVVAIFGMFLSNVILQAIDSATTTSSMPASVQGAESLLNEASLSDGKKTYINYIFYGESAIPTSATPISGQIFITSAYKANRIRYYGPFQAALASSNFSGGGNLFKSNDLNKSANLLDTCFANGYQLKTEMTITAEPFEKDYMHALGKSGNAFFSNSPPKAFTYFDKNNIALVWYYYDLWSFDFIICIAALVVGGKILIDLVFGLMKRLFELVILFIIAAPMASLMPLDEGAALNGWRKKFISKAIGTYAPILGLNMLFLILPELSRIKFFGIPILDSVVNMIFIIVGLLMIKDLVGMMAELVGGEDTLKAGAGMAGEVGGTLGKVAKTAVAPGAALAKVAKGGAKIAGGLGRAGAKAAGSIGSSIKSAATSHGDRQAEDGYLLDNMGGLAKYNFDRMSKGAQKKELKRLRLSMGDEEREEALGNRDENRKKFISTTWRGKVADKTKDKISNISTGIKDKKQEITQKVKESKLVKGFTDKKQELAEKVKASKLGQGFIKGKDKIRSIPESIKDKFYETDIGKKAKERQGYLNRFRGLTYGAQGSEKREKNEKLIEERRASEKEEKKEKRAEGRASAKEEAKMVLTNVKDAGKSIADAVKESLNALTQHLKGEFSEGWKKEGGFKGVLNAATGVSGKDTAFKEAVKEQTKALKAQAAAQEILSKQLNQATTTSSGGSSTVNISPEGAEAIAKAIADHIKK